MAQPTCTACSRNTPGGQMSVCYTCRDDTRRHLDQITGDYDAAIEPRSPIPGQRRRIGHARPAPMNDRAGAARTRTRDTLVAWLDAVDPDALSARETAQKAGTVHALTRALRTHEDALLARHDADQYVTDLADTARDLDRAVLPGRRPGTTIAACPCGGNVTAHTITGKARCGSCGTTAPATEWTADDTLLTDEQAIRYLAVIHGRVITTGTLRTWRHRGQLPPATLLGQHALTRRADLDQAVKPVITTTAA